MNNEEKSLHKSSINWYPGHMAKTKRLIGERLSLIDIVLEVVDARIPYSSKIIDLDNYIKDKPRLMIMTKYDLCDKVETNKWIDYYKSIGYKVVPIDLLNNFSPKEILKCIDEILADKNIKRENKGLSKRKVRALIVGIPNAGKSTLINRLVGKKAVNVGNKPGITKNLNWIRINDKLELLDTPGILWPKFEDDIVAYNLASLTAIKEEVLPISRVVCYILETLYKHYPNVLKERYGICHITEDFVEEFETIGKKRGCLVHGGEVDYDKVSTIVLNDIKEGYIKNITFDRFNFLDKNDILKCLDNYNLDKNEFIILSGSSLVLQDIKKYAKDIDIAVSDILEKELLENYNCEIERVAENNKKVYYIDGIINFSTNLYDVESINLSEYRIQTLESIVKMKQQFNRKKDIEDIRIIEKVKGEK